MPAGIVIVALGATTLLSTTAAFADGGGNGISEFRHVVFPVQEPVSYTDTFGDCRDGCWRRHEGNDLIGQLRLSQGLAAGNQCRYPTLPPLDPTTASAAGYWATTAHGAVYSFGAPQYYGGLATAHLNAPITGMTARTTSHGYWMLGTDRGIFSFGDAPFYGSTGAMHLNKPVVSMAATPTGAGYWLLTSDGGVFSFGDARFYGSTPQLGLCADRPAVSLASSHTGHGYWMLQDGRVLAFGDAESYGDASAQHAPTVALAVMP